MVLLTASTTSENSSVVLAPGENPNEHRPGLWRTGISSSVLLFLAYLSLAMAGAPFTQLILERACADHHLDADHCHAKIDGKKVPGYDAAQKDSASFMSMYYLAKGILEIGTCTFYGVLGDRFGRRVPLLSATIGQLLGGVAIAVLPASRQHDVFLIAVMCISTLGGSFVMNACAMATLADVTQHVSAKQRSAVFAMVEAANWGGMLIGPALGGVIAQETGNQKCFYIFSCVNFLNILVTFFTYRETLEKDRRQPFRLDRANPIAALALFGQTKIVALMGVLFFLGMFAGSAMTSVIGLYAIKVADLDTLELGLMGSLGLGSGCIGLVVVMPMLVKCFSLPRVMSVSLLNSALVALLLSVAQGKMEIFAFQACSVCGAVIYPVVRIGMINTFGRKSYGQTLASIGTLEQTITMLGPVVFQNIYRATENIEFDIGSIRVGCITMLVSCGCSVLGLLVSLFLREIPRNCDWDSDKLSNSEVH